MRAPEINSTGSVGLALANASANSKPDDFGNLYIRDQKVDRSAEALKNPKGGIARSCQ